VDVTASVVSESVARVLGSVNLEFELKVVVADISPLLGVEDSIDGLAWLVADS